MNTREIDRLVAEKVMGWKWEYNDMLNRYVSRDEKGFWHLNFCPSTDLLDAWQVVEKIIEQFGSYSLTKIKDGGHYCEVLYWNNGAFDVIAEVEAETAPLAICLAALKAMGVEMEGKK
jgi:Phage ABA sandwich domain